MKRTLFRRLLLGIVIFLTGIVAEAAAVCSRPTGARAFETITVSTTSLRLTAATSAGSLGALVTIETNPIRYRFDGTAPTAAVGHLAPIGQAIEVCGGDNIRNFRMIRQGAADATATVSYFR